MDYGKDSVDTTKGAAAAGRRCSFATVVWGLLVTVFSVGSVLCCILFYHRISYGELDCSRVQSEHEDRIQEWVQRYVEKEVNRLVEKVSLFPPMIS